MNYSPVLSIITALFEISVAIWAIKGPGRKKIIYASSSILIILAIYQILEVIVCEVYQGNMFFSRLALLMVTWLPPTGLLLIAYLYPATNKKTLRYSQLMFAFAFMIVVWILLDKEFVLDSVCTIIFARYVNPIPRYMIYGGFYQIGLFSMLFLSILGIMKCENDNQQRLLGQVLLGSLFFIYPAMITVIAIPSTTGALPSIMCHYALLFAFFITRLIYLERKISTNKNVDKEL